MLDRRQSGPAVRRTPAVALAALIALTGCAAVGPNYRAPTLTVPAAFSGRGQAASTDSAQDDVGQWWRIYRDPNLDGLIERGLLANLDIRTATSRILQARAQERVAGAAGWPSVGVGPEVSETRLSRNAGLTSLGKAFAGGGAVGLPGTSYQTYQASFDAAWELDVFGGVRRGVEVARATTAAQVWDLRDAQVSLAAEIAVDYLDLRDARARLAIALARVEAESLRRDLLSARRAAGLDARTTASEQAERLANAAAAVPPIQARITLDKNALAVLVARPPGSLAAELDAPAVSVEASLAPPPGLPSELLRRRPDIRAAERRLAAANAQVGVATAGLYPSFNLTGSGGLISTALSNLVSTGSLQGAAAGAINWPILDGGRARGQLAAAREGYVQAQLAYEKAVLTALKDVEDALARYQADRERQVRLDQAVAADTDILVADQALEAAGQASRTLALDARLALLIDQDAQAQGVDALGQDVAGLYKALGGGWRSAASTNSTRTDP